jgi:glutamate carboxypeptidase
MKGGLAVLVYALKALAEAGFLEELNVALILGSDEESGSVTSHPVYLKERENAIACLVAECAGPNGEVVVSRNGKLGARIDSFGRDRHVGENIHEKASAILELAERVIAVESLNALLPGVSVNVGTIEGGLGPCTVPAHASCLIDVRWSGEEEREIVLEKLTEEVSSSRVHDCRSEMTILNSRPAMPLSGKTLWWLKLLEGAGHRLGLEIGREHRRGTSDANFFGAAGVPTIDGFGPVCHNDHTQDEHILISSLRQRSALLAHFLLDYGMRAGKPA